MTNKILLINPAINPVSQNRVINEVIAKTLPTSLGVLAGYVIDSRAASVEIIDEQMDFLQDKNIEEALLSMERPRIIGLSVLTINSKRAYALSEKIKRIDPEAIVVLGGIHPSVIPQESLSRQGVDIVVRGEGEETFKELIETAFNERDFRRVQGISYSRNGDIVHNQARSPIDDLNGVPPFPYQLFEKNFNKYSTFG